MNDSDAAQAPSRIRYLIVFLAMMMATLLYLDRFSITLMERYVTEDLGLTNDQSAIYLSIFFYAYALSQVPAGWLTDRYGARLMLTIYIVGWSLFTAATGLVQGFVMLLVVRILFGMTQAGAYPTAASLLSRWVPITARGTASGIVSFGGRIGGAVVSLLTGLLMVAFVPVSESSLLEPRDIFDARELTYELKNQPDPAKKSESKKNKPKEDTAPQPEELIQRDLRASLFAALPAPLQRKLEQFASGPKKAADAGLLSNLANALNDQLQRPDLFDAEALAKLKLEPQAARIRAMNPSERTPEETARMNRLVLEQIAPDPIRKIYGRAWRPLTVIYGLSGIFVAAMFWFLFRNSPAEHPRCNAAEIGLIEKARPVTDKAGGPVGNLPWMKLLGSVSIWCCCIVQVGTNIGWVFIVTWFPRYLWEVHKVDLIERGLMTSLPMFFGIAGNFLGGWITDAATSRFGLRWGRSLPVALTRYLCAAAFVLCLWFGSPWEVTVLMCAMAFCTDLGIASIWAFNQDIGGRFVGSVLGWGNMWGNLGAAVSPVLLNFAIENFSWNAMFLTCAAAFTAAGTFAFGINATQNVD